MLGKLNHSQKGKILPFLLQNWWVLTIIVMTFALYAQAIYQKKQLATKLQEKCALLEAKLAHAKVEKELLTLRLNSEDDPEWIELALKQKLGVVPEGETKVVFRSNSENVSKE